MTLKHIFFSGRFGGEKEVVARELYAALRKLGVNAHIVDAGPGRAFGAKTIYGLVHMELMICIVYDDYGEKTDSSSCTFWELKHAIDNHIPIYYLKMSDIFPPKPPQDFDGGNEGPDQIKFFIKKDDFYHDWSGKEWNAMICAKEVKQELHKIFEEKHLDERILKMNPNDLSTLSNSPQVQELTQDTPEPVVDIENGGTFEEPTLNKNPNDLVSTPSNSPRVQELTAQHTPKPVVDIENGHRKISKRVKVTAVLVLLMLGSLATIVPLTLNKKQGPLLEPPTPSPSIISSFDPFFPEAVPTAVPTDVECDYYIRQSVQFGDGKCDGGLYNTEECGWDGGDCDLYNSLVDCTVDYPELLNNGDCNDYVPYNTEACGWDGGDCTPPTTAP